MLVNMMGGPASFIIYMFGLSIIVIDLGHRKQVFLGTGNLMRRSRIEM